MTSEIITIEAMFAVGIAISVDAFQSLLAFVGIGIYLNWMITFFIAGLFDGGFFKRQSFFPKSLLSSSRQRNRVYSTC